MELQQTQVSSGSQAVIGTQKQSDVKKQLQQVSSESVGEELTERKHKMFLLPSNFGIVQRTF